MIAVMDYTSQASFTVFTYRNKWKLVAVVEEKHEKHLSLCNPHLKGPTDTTFDTLNLFVSFLF